MKKILLLLIFLIIPFSVSAEELIPNSISGILIEANSGKIIFEKDKDKEVSIASMTKMVAQIIILKEIQNNKIKWTDIVTVSKNASDMGGSQIYLEQGEKMSVEDLMKGISVASANDATVAMAEFISGTEEKFVERMNKKVKELGLKHTNFKNATGLDEENHYSSAYDMAMIAKELITNYKEILRFSSIQEDYLRQNTEHKFWLVNTNKLVRQYEGTDGLKTGHTDNAGYCLAATTKRNNLRLIAIVLGEKDSKVRNSETISLLDYGFQNTKVKILKEKNTTIDKISIEKAIPNKIPIKLKEDLSIIEDTNSKNIKYKYKTHINTIKTPLTKNETIGYIEAIYNNKQISKVDLINSVDIKKIKLLDLFYKNLNNLLYGIL